MKSVLAASIILAGLSACSSPAPVDPAAKAEAELDICEVVFRHQFNHNASAVQQAAAAYFISIRDQDPSPGFMARFAGQLPVVLPGSEFEVGKGLGFRVDSIEWLKDGGVNVSGGYYEANLSASGNTYRVERDGNTWKVTADEMEWIS